MLSSEILSWVTFAYGFSFLVFTLYQLMRKEFLNRLGDITVVLALSVHGIALILRWRESYQLSWGHVPLTNFYESLIFLSFVLSLTYVLFRYSTRLKHLGAFIMPLPLLTLAYASLSPDIDRGIRPLVPALQSNWLTIHVVTCFLSYAAFAFSFIFAILYLVKRDNKGRKILPPKERLDEFVYRGVLLGMPLLTMGILTGSAWAHYAWGSYWSWDPKETWSLITWIIYTIFLHARFIRGWRGKSAAILSIIGFIAVLFTFLGVNYIISGLHSYM